MYRYAQINNKNSIRTVFILVVKHYYSRANSINITKTFSHVAKTYIYPLAELIPQQFTVLF